MRIVSALPPLFGDFGPAFPQGFGLTFGEHGLRSDHRLWIVMVLIEHFILILRFTIQSIVPEEPSWIGKAKLQVRLLFGHFLVLFGHLSCFRLFLVT